MLIRSSNIHKFMKLTSIFIVKVVGLGFMVFNTTNNISVISWKSVLLVKETRVSGENHRPVASY